MVYVDPSGEARRQANNALLGLESGSGSSSSGRMTPGGSMGGGGGRGGSGSSGSKPSTSSNGQANKGTGNLSDSISSKALKQIGKKWG
ncbi:hypothetical protein [Paenibacillus sp. QZ-Y1]|uniref:hypothetical protein n=1 Tax=Paenibacillus sp. QZ-Y1 TaxID=3414511 RepID=UPI003F7A8E28